MKHLLVARVDQIRQGLEGVGCRQAGVPVGRRDVYSGVDEDGVDELVDAHVLQHLFLVLFAHIVAILQNSTAFQMQHILPASSGCIGIGPDPCAALRQSSFGLLCSLNESRLRRCSGCLLWTGGADAKP